MRFFTAASALVAFAASAIAQNSNFNPVLTPTTSDGLKVGQTVEITWQVKEPFNNGNVNIELIGGPTQNTQTHITDIAANVVNSVAKYSWTIPEDIGEWAFYGIKFVWLDDQSIIQYSMPLHITGGSDDEPTTSASATASATGTSTDSETTPIVTDDVTKTVTLTSCPPESATQYPNGTAPVWTTKVWNTTVNAPTYLPTGALPTTTYTPGNGNGDVPSAPAPAPTSGAARVGAGLLAIVGAAALLL